MLFLLFSLLFCEVSYISCINVHRPMVKTDPRTKMAEKMIVLAEDLIRNLNEKVYLVANARQDNSESAPYEIGYLTQMIQEHYRRMLDKWESTRMDIKLYYGLEVALYLEEIEHYYWAIKHEVYMLHEIERKYHVRSLLNESYEDPLYDRATPFPTPPMLDSAPKQKPKKFNQKKFMANSVGKNAKNNNKHPNPDIAGIMGGAQGMGGIDGMDPELFDKIIGNFGTTRKPKKKRLPINYGWDIYEWSSNT